MAELFDLTQAPIDVAALRARLNHPAAGGVCVFEGVVRDHHAGRQVLRLRYEAYESLARSEGARIVTEVRQRFGLLGATVVHRIGPLEIGEVAVWVGASAPHRDAAFAACRALIDAIKTDVPIWKHESYVDGDARWLHPS